MIYVLAHDYDQYLNWCHENNKSDGQDCKFVFGLYDLYGIHLGQSARLVELANWEENKNGDFISAANRVKEAQYQWN